MAKARAIVKRLKAVRNVRKITRTMELVATARFKKAMDRATQAAAYTRKISEIVADLSEALQDSGALQGSGSSVSHPLLQQRESEKKSILLVVTSNRGLCGGYNAAVLRHTQTLTLFPYTTLFRSDDQTEAALKAALQEWRTRWETTVAK